MPRNSSGACSLAEAAFVAATPITSASMNSDLDDIATMLTDSLSRSGKGGMQATLPLATTGFVYSADPDTGISRSAANTQVITVGGEDYTFTADDVTNPDGLSLLPLVGEIRMWALPTAPTGWIFMRGQAATLAANPLWRAALIAASSPYGTSGADPLFPDLRCVAPAGLDVGARGLLTGSDVLGALLGAQTVTLSEAQMPAHSHAGATGTESAAHTHDIAGQIGTTTSGFDASGGGSVPNNPTSGRTSTIESASHTHAFTTDSKGSSQAHPNVQPTIILNFIGRDA